MKNEDNRERFDIIVSLREAGKTYRQIGDMVGVTRQRIHQILSKKDNFFKINPLFSMGGEEISSVLLSKASANNESNPIASILSGSNISSATGMMSGSRERFRELIRLRDRCTCQWCGKVWVPGTRRFDVHHILGGSEDSRSVGGNQLEMVTLCHRCHLNIDSWKIKDGMNKKNTI